MLRGAFIGFGNVAACGHLPGWQRSGEAAIVAAADTNAARRDAFLAASPDGRWHESIDSLFAGETLDFVDICTPPGGHAALIGRALDAGLHVLCEKPLVTRAGDGAALASMSGGRVIHCVHNWLEAPMCRKVTELLSKGAIGPVRSLRWRTLRTQPALPAAADDGANWRINPEMAGGGILIDHGWHALYCLVRWSGMPPKAISATLETRRLHQSPLEDTAEIELDFGAATGHVFLTWTADERVNSIDVEGDAGHIRVDASGVALHESSGERQWAFAAPLSEGSHHPEWFDGVAREFCSAVDGTRASNLEEALMCARLIDLARESARLGGTRVPFKY